jgi:hypothetical protein
VLATVFDPVQEIGESASRFGGGNIGH